MTGGRYSTIVRITKEVPQGATVTATVKVIDHRLGTKARSHLVDKVAGQFRMNAQHAPDNLVPRPDVAPSIQLDAYERAMSELQNERARAERAITRLEPLRAQIMFGPDTRSAFLKEVAEGKHLKDTSGDMVPTSAGRAA